MLIGNLGYLGDKRVCVCERQNAKLGRSLHQGANKRIVGIDWLKAKQVRGPRLFSTRTFDDATE